MGACNFSIFFSHPLVVDLFPINMVTFTFPFCQKNMSRCWPSIFNILKKNTIFNISKYWIQHFKWTTFNVLYGHAETVCINCWTSVIKYGSTILEMLNLKNSKSKEHWTYIVHATISHAYPRTWTYIGHMPIPSLVELFAPVLSLEWYLFQRKKGLEWCFNGLFVFNLQVFI